MKWFNVCKVRQSIIVNTFNNTCNWQRKGDRKKSKKGKKYKLNQLRDINSSNPHNYFMGFLKE